MSAVYSFQSITLPPLQRARQDRKIEVCGSGGDIEIEATERKGGEDTAPQGAETWPNAIPPGLGPQWGKSGERTRIEQRVIKKKKRERAGEYEQEGVLICQTTTLEPVKN